jgi:hypothetical protein
MNILNYVVMIAGAREQPKPPRNVSNRRLLLSSATYHRANRLPISRPYRHFWTPWITPVPAGKIAYHYPRQIKSFPLTKSDGGYENHICSYCWLGDKGRFWQVSFNLLYMENRSYRVFSRSGQKKAPGGSAGGYKPLVG